MLINLFPDDLKIQFMKNRWFFFALSSLLILASLILVPTRGLNFGIDFVGGIVIEIETPEKVDIGGIRTALEPLQLGDVQVQEINDVGMGASETGRVAMIRAQAPKGQGDAAESAVQSTTNRILDVLKSKFGDIEVRRNEAVGPKVSGELLQSGMTALVVALVLMLLYIWFRFEWQFSIGAIIATVHDVILTLGMLSLTQTEFNLSTIAALLTIVGYSMNDTVIVYDRVREELRRYKKLPVAEVIDLAVNNTLSRTTLTSGTTLLALVSIFLFGGDVLRSFSFALIWGIFVGTFSSIFVASALLLHTGVRRGGGGASGRTGTDDAAAPA